MVPTNFVVKNVNVSFATSKSINKMFGMSGERDENVKFNVNKLKISYLELQEFLEIFMFH